MQFKAGYLVDSIAQTIQEFRAKLDEKKTEDEFKLHQIKGLLQHLSSFDVEFPDGFKPNFSKLNPVLATINNIITRGLPTRAPLILEQIFIDIGLTKKSTDEFEFNYPDTIDPISYETIFELLHIIEPKLEIDKPNYGGDLGSDLEWKFLETNPILKQILQSQRDFSTINSQLPGERTVDFSYIAPYLQWNKKNNRYEKVGRIFEVDGSHHKLSEYRLYDAYRDSIAELENFETIRTTAETINQVEYKIEALFGSRIFDIYKKNFERDINDHIREYSLIFIPFAVARIQKTILEYLLVNSELLNIDKISIAIIERDLPCGAIAIRNLKELFLNINSLLKDEDKIVLPEIHLTIFENTKWVLDKKLHLTEYVKDEDNFEPNEYDIVLDHSILRRSNVYNETNFKFERSIKIRSSHYFDTSFGNNRRIYCADLLNYKELVKKKDDGSYIAIPQFEKHINYFIKNIFRKVRFRDGQLPIISRALQRKAVIGLLPTGGGKSLTFQLPAFLQPGLCLIVDPIKSLMEDQVRVLNENWIDNCDYINSNLQRVEKAKKLTDFKYGETMFLFVSPERFVMQEFRNIIQTIDASKFGLAFSYCVIDEVHCVSEWGHDFRTTYLMLGRNAQKFAKTKSGKPVTLLGLTATASFDVLTDIERELSINTDEEKDAVISIDNTIRPELFFTIIENTVKPNYYPILSQKLKDTIGYAKQVQINDYIQNINKKLDSINNEVVNASLDQHYNEFEITFNSLDENQANYRNTIKNKILEETNLNDHNYVETIIFCPHTTGTLGITQDANEFPSNKEIFENLTIIPPKNKGYFMGGDDKIKKSVLENAQEYFHQFMQGKINYMVCTKAFGMGIDKKHIRSVYHLNFSSSPESYIQEAGRAGRDKVKSICTIFFDRNFYYTADPNFIKENYPHNLSELNLRKNARRLFEQYDSNLNIIRPKYYEDKSSLISAFKTIGIDLDPKYIQEFNQDLGVHEYFHSNSYKGIETEVFQLNRLIEEIEGINTTQLKLSQEKYNLEYNDDIKLTLTTTGEYQGNIWVNNTNGITIGKIFSKKANPTSAVLGLGAPEKQAPDLIKTEEILDFLQRDCSENSERGTILYDFLQKEIIDDLNKGLSLIEYFNNTEQDSFWFKVPSLFKSNDLESQIIKDFELNRLPIIDKSKEIKDYINTLKKYSSSYEDFILRIEEQWDKEILNNPIFIENTKEYKRKYYSEITTADVSKMIYRMYSIGLVNDYTIDYNLGIISFEVLKRDKNYYLEKTQAHILKYRSRTVTLEKIEKLRGLTQEMSIFDTVKQCLKEIINLTYKDIVTKRKDAVNELYKYISESLDQARQKTNDYSFQDFWYNFHFKEEMYYYFNAKYARAHFEINNESYSLLEITDKGRKSEWGTFEKFAKILNDQSSFISECKMMRGSCRRIWRTLSKEDYEREYILKLLSAFATFGLNNKYYYQEAEDLLIDGFYILYKQTEDFKVLKSCMENFEDHLFNSTSNKNYRPYLILAKHRVMLKVNSEFSNAINKQLEQLEIVI